MTPNQRFLNVTKKGYVSFHANFQGFGVPLKSTTCVKTKKFLRVREPHHKNPQEYKKIIRRTEHKTSIVVVENF